MGGWSGSQPWTRPVTSVCRPVGRSYRDAATVAVGFIRRSTQRRQGGPQPPRCESHPPIFFDSIPSPRTGQTIPYRYFLLPDSPLLDLFFVIVSSRKGMGWQEEPWWTGGAMADRKTKRRLPCPAKDQEENQGTRRLHFERPQPCGFVHLLLLYPSIPAATGGTGGRITCRSRKREKGLGFSLSASHVSRSFFGPVVMIWSARSIETLVDGLLSLSMCLSIHPMSYQRVARSLASAVVVGAVQLVRAVRRLTSVGVLSLL